MSLGALVEFTNWVVANSANMSLGELVRITDLIVKLQRIASF